MDSIELTILMPCLDEAETIERCVVKAMAFLARASVVGEVLVSDNGSTDGSQGLALSLGARVVHAPERGYGAALINGIAQARGRFIIMGDADDSYDFSSLDEMLAALRAGIELVMGNRFQGGIEAGAMPFLHRYLGNPVLSFLGRLFFRAPIGDFHCGLRGFSREAILRLDLQTNGMEFASEMVVKASLHGVKVAEVPVVLSQDGRSRPPHLRTWRDGWRHLRFLLLFSPRWLFLFPGFLLLTIGALGMTVIGSGLVVWGRVGFDIHSLAYSGVAVLLGVQMLLFALLSKVAGIKAGWLPPDPRVARFLALASLEWGLVISVLLFATALLMSFHAVVLWRLAGFGALDPTVTMRWVIPAGTLFGLSGTVFLGAFFLEALRIPGSGRRERAQ